MGLAASVGELQLADGLIVPAGEAVGDILGELPDVVGWVCEGEELVGVSVYLVALVHGYVVEVGGEHGEAELAGFEVASEGYDLVPGLPEGCGHLVHLCFIIIFL